MKKIANLVFNPFVNDSRVWKESNSLLKHNYLVEVLAHHSKGLLERETKDGIIINRFGYLDREKTTGNFGKILAYIVFVFKCVRYSKKFDILHCNDLNTLPIAYFVKLFYGKKYKVVYDAHELETAIQGLKGIKKIIVKWAERNLINTADKVIVVSDSIANEYVKLYNIKKPIVILNAPYYINKVEKRDIFRQELNIRLDQNIFLYQGLLSDGRGLDILVKTFKSFQSDSNIIIFMGHGDMKDKIQNEAAKNKNIYFYNSVSPNILLNYTSSADYGISLIEDTCLSYHYCLPNKLFEYLMSFIPVIVSDLPEMRKVVEGNNVGVVSKINAESLGAKIKSIIEIDKSLIMDNITRTRKIYNWEEQEILLIKLYKELYN
jgi:glycosyltransferase involved in cell wall biosynthesis